VLKGLIKSITPITIYPCLNLQLTYKTAYMHVCVYMRETGELMIVNTIISTLKHSNTQTRMVVGDACLWFSELLSCGIACGKKYEYRMDSS
jgi:hypothetical protein